jgi:ATP-binding cassette subfamily F protein 3
MNLLTIQNLTKYNANYLILDKINLKINHSNRYGLIGPNGSGKSTLLKVILSVLENQPDYEEGRIHLAPEAKIAYVPQLIDFALEKSSINFVLKDIKTLEEKIRIAEEQLVVEDPDELEKALVHYQEIRDQWDEQYGDNAEDRAKKILTQLGLGEKFHQDPSSLSGGEQRLVLLARALLSNPNLLILDEPDNHLDFQVLDTLERVLLEFPGAILLVSHNRYLLDRVCTHILELDNKTIQTYSGNYSQYRLDKIKNLAAQQASYANDQKRIARLERLVKYLTLLASAKPDPSTGARLKARKSHLRMAKDDATEKPSIDQSQFSLDLETQKVKADIALEINDYEKKYGAKEVIQASSTLIHAGQKVALLGLNGSGKTSLINDVVEKADWNFPMLRLGPQMKIGYIPQHHEESKTGQSVESYVRDFGALSKDQAFSLLSPYGFGWDDMQKSFDYLSGGEKTRILFAKFEYDTANFLILDEPTNHMDIFSREKLEDSLADFTGTLLVISHDRYFLDKITNRNLGIVNKTIQEFPGGINEFIRCIRPIQKAPNNASNVKKERFEGLSKQNDLEEKIENLEETLKNLEKEILQQIEANKHQKARDLSKKLEKERKLLNDLYKKWESAM